MRRFGFHFFMLLMVIVLYNCGHRDYAIVNQKFIELGGQIPGDGVGNINIKQFDQGDVILMTFDGISLDQMSNREFTSFMAKEILDAAKTSGLEAHLMKIDAEVNSNKGDESFSFKPEEINTYEQTFDAVFRFYKLYSEDRFDEMKSIMDMESIGGEEEFSELIRQLNKLELCGDFDGFDTYAFSFHEDGYNSFRTRIERFRTEDYFDFLIDRSTSKISYIDINSTCEVAGLPDYEGDHWWEQNE